ncbi:hypothetical protein M9435_005882 [Picochlorum sp. BPE23]|nr:hypothetical protein M9435_005882 [Picochlorum sp. BPE23]
MNKWVFIITSLLAVAIKLLSAVYLKQPLPSNQLVAKTHETILNLYPKTFDSYGSGVVDEEVMKGSMKLFQGSIKGPESVHVLRNGSAIVLDRYGHVYVSESDSSELKIFSYIGPGRPLGYTVVSHGGKSLLVVCNSLVGVEALDLESRELVILTSSVQEFGNVVPITYANDIDVDEEEGILYFSDSTTGIPPGLNRMNFYDTMKSYVLSSLSGKPTGKLLSYNLNTGVTEILMKDLFFANGVALSLEKDFVLVAETSFLRIKKYHLVGPKAGTSEVFIENLPGYPDGITRGPDGNFYVALLFCPMQMHLLMAKAPQSVRWLLSWVAPIYTPLPPKVGAVMKISSAGKVLRIYVDREGHTLYGISGLFFSKETNKLYMGHLSHDFISVMQLP